jgi:uncharacterized surface protein with fasciclin (FAS1) repeats
LRGKNQPEFHQAVGQAGLVEVLNQGDVTIFAPTDEAFAQIPDDQLTALLNNQAKLTELLLYHVVPGQLTAADVTSADQLTTANELSLKISADGSTVMINNAKVIAANLEASDGIIHAIDKVLMPSNAIGNSAAVTTVAGSDLAIGTDDDQLTVNGQPIVTADIPAANGVVHIIDSVLLPPEFR